MNKKLRVAVLAGGMSSEREVSLESGKNVAQAVKDLGYDLKTYDPATDLVKIVEDKDWIDVVFPALHGRYGEDGAIQGLCELIGVPYVGCGVLASALAIDKEQTLRVYNSVGLPTAKVIFVNNGAVDIDQVEKEIGFPCVVKPVRNGSSIGVEIVDEKSKFPEAIEKVASFHDGIMVEEYLKGREITVGVLGNNEPEALPVLEIKPKNRFYDYNAKYKEETDLNPPLGIGDEIIARAQDYAISAHLALGCRGLSRTDMIIRDSVPILLETNTMPGMTSHSLVPRAEKEVGVSFQSLIDRLLHLALEEKDGDR